MKLNNFIFYCFAGVSFLFAGCNKDFLNTNPQSLVTDDAVFQDLGFAQAFLNETYTGVPSGYERGFYLLDDATDIGYTGYPWAVAHLWQQGNVSPTNIPRFAVPWDGNIPTPWANWYNYVRRANTILGQIDGVPVPASDIDKIALKKTIKGEAYFLRALFYHELVKLYGGVPIIKRPQSFTESQDALLVPRNTYDECVNLIVSDLDSAALLLPVKFTGKDVGRATKAAALALKGRQLLYAERWNESAQASLAVLNMPDYSLFPNYEQLFWAANNNNSEVIFARQYLSKATNRIHQANQWNAPASRGGWGGTQPTQNLVDQYEMTDGLTFDKSPLYKPLDPYKNRDPRFDATVLHDKSIWIGDTLNLTKGAFQGIGGKSNDATKTGYYLRKFLDPAIITADFNNGYNNWNNIRLAEVKLNYAEAVNEATGPDASVYSAINDIRMRPSVSMPPLAAGLTKDQMRDRIRHERLIELAFEEHRFFDLRRWKDAGGQYLANTILAQPIYGMQIDSARTTYTVFKKQDLVYDPKDRLFPIEQSEINKYGGKLVQNPGW